MRVRVAVVSLRKVTVEARKDGVLPLRIVGVAGPLADARSTGVGEHDAPHLLEVLELPIALDGEADELGARRDGEFGLDLKVLSDGLLRETSGAVEVLVGGSWCTSR